MLTICWSDGVSCLPMDFALLTSSDAKKRLCESYNPMDRRCCAWQRRKEATTKATENLETLVKRILAAGIYAKYLLMYNWFTMPATVAAVCEHIDVIGMVNEEIIRIYGKHLDIEVFFKMAKQHLKLAKEIQCRDFDALIAHTNIVFMRYMFLAYQCRMETDHRPFGDLFYSCCDEMANISFIEAALYRLLTLAGERLREIGSYCEKTASVIFDAIIENALKYVSLAKSDGVTVLP
jgi:hypothetical protein